MGSYLYALIIYPIEMFIEFVFTISMNMIPSAGYAIVFVSIAVQLLVLPMYKRADELQDEERQRQKDMAPFVKHIKKTFHGDERVMMLSTYYRCENYHMYYQLKAILPLLLQIPFFMAAYNFLSACPALEGASFYFLKDMGKPDEMIKLGGFAINVMPIAMTLINVISGAIYTRGLELKDKLQLYLTAAVFLVLLYDSPSGLVFYWTLNNVFSLLKNIFMKLVKHPRPIISIASIVFVLAYCYKCYVHGAWATESGKIVMVLVFAIGLIPAIGMLLDRNGSRDGLRGISDKELGGASDENKVIFRVAGIVATIALGVMIPVVTIASSPTEFVIRGHYVNPIVQVIYSFVVALGLFVLWGNLIYNFYLARAKKLLCFAMVLIAVCGLVNFQFYREGLRNMSMNMLYYDGFGYDTSEKLRNLAVLFGVCIVLFALYKLGKKAVLFLCYALAGVVIAISGYNIVKIQRTLSADAHIKDDDYYINSNAKYELDKSGKNVIVLFEDRAFGQFMPYILYEKPELKKAFAGFTLYSNTLSHGTNTSTGSPGLYGGYEYTPYNLRDKEDSFKENCVKVMPRVFAEEGYKTTVFDKPHYIHLDDTSLEEFYANVHPDIKAFYADGVVKTAEEASRDYEYFDNAAKRNYLRHSIFISSPLLLRQWLYDGGTYLTQNLCEDIVTFAGHIEELNKLGDMANVSDTGSNTFTFIENDTTHSMDISLQMPDYTLEERVDNSQYLSGWKDMLSTASDRGINMNTDTQQQAYEVNMAAMMSLAKWMEYLWANDLYDNTRIIIVADHGYSFFTFDDMLMDNDGEITDLDMFTPLLMVKDFADTNPVAVSSEITVSDEFMTNADVPTLAMEGLIENPVNPYTDNPINSDEKKHDQYVFDDRIWLTVHDNIYDMNNWKVVEVE